MWFSTEGIRVPIEVTRLFTLDIFSTAPYYPPQ